MYSLRATARKRSTGLCPAVGPDEAVPLMGPVTPGGP